MTGSLPGGASGVLKGTQPLDQRFALLFRHARQCVRQPLSPLLPPLFDQLLPIRRQGKPDDAPVLRIIHAPQLYVLLHF